MCRIMGQEIEVINVIISLMYEKETSSNSQVSDRINKMLVDIIMLRL